MKEKQKDLVKNARARVIYEKSPFAISFWEKDVSLIDVNDSFMEMFDATDKETLLKEFPRLYTPEFQPCGTPSAKYTQDNTDKAVEFGSYKFKLMHQDKEGNPIPCEIVSVSAYFDESHVIIAYARDLREEVKLAAQLEEAHERVRLMLDSTPLACFLIDKDFTAIDCNMEAVALFGLDSKQATINSFSKISRCGECGFDKRKCEVGEISCKLKLHFQTAFRKGHAKIEWHLRAPEDAIGIPCEINYVRLEYKNEYVVAAYITDLRTLKKMLEDRRKLEIAEENSLAKSQFLASMSHEIRTPMNAILGITEIQLQKKTMSDEMKEAFEKIYVSGDMLMGIINDLLDLSKIEAGKMELVIERYETVSMIHDTVVLNLMRLDTKDVKFELSVDEDLPAYMLGDELRIKQILNNILSNAFKYTEKGVVKMIVGHEPSDDDTKANLIFTISDTGLGMSKEDVAKLFDAYARFNPTANRAIVGTGLGMSITRNLLELMDGSINVDSELGKGSTFYIRLPQTIVGDDVVGSVAAKNLGKFQLDTRAAMKRAQINYEPMPYGKILIVDDVEMNIYVAKGLLSPYMLEIDSADSGFKAISKVKEGNEYDIVFMDHMMPQMDGIETTKRIRELGYKRPIVALTANAIAGQADIFMQSGFDDFISKPIDIRQLNLVLNRQIRDMQPPEVLEAARRQTMEIIEQDEGFDDYMKSPEFLEIVYKDFAVNHVNVVNDIKHAIATGDLKTAHFLTHSLKGVAGLLGEGELVALCSEAEFNFRRERVPAVTVEKMYAEVERLLKVAEGYVME